MHTVKVASFAYIAVGCMYRFYFLGDDDLLEILGQPSNPDVIQSHLTKLFAGIHSLCASLASSGSPNVSSTSKEASVLTSMFSSDGEEVQFPSAVAVTAVVEEWLAGVCTGMRHALQVLLPSALRDAGRHETGLDPGSRQWAVLPAQVLSLVQDISFTQVGPDTARFTCIRWSARNLISMSVHSLRCITKHAVPENIKSDSSNKRKFLMCNCALEQLALVFLGSA
jgi:hypothetical protein